MVKVKKDDLTDIPGVGEKTAGELMAAGYTDFILLAGATGKEINERCEIGEATANKYIAEARKLAKIGDFVSSSEIKSKRENLRRITTCSAALDNLFKNPKDPGAGGLESQSITEFFGQFGSGKTQLCFQLAVNCTAPVEQGGLGTKCIVIDTENTFRPSRIEQIAEARGFDVQNCLDNILVARAFNSPHQMLLLQDKAYELAKEHEVGMIIIDSLTSHFRSEYIGRGKLADRQQNLSNHMRDLLRFVYSTNSIGIVTNQVLTDPGQMFGDPIKPVGGNIVGHSSTYRIYLKKSKNGKRVARMIDAPDLPESEVVINISSEGVRDE